MRHLFATLESLAPRVFSAPDTGAPEGGAAVSAVPPAVAPASAVADAFDEAALMDSMSLVKDPAPAAAPEAAATPAAEAVVPAAPETPAAPVTPATPAAADYQALQQSIQAMHAEIAELRKRAEAPPTPVPGTPAAPAVGAASAGGDPDILEKMAADDYEIDMEKDPKVLARELAALKKQYKLERAALDTKLGETVAAKVNESFAQQQSREAAEASQRAFEDLQRQHAGTDLLKLFQDARQEAAALGYGRLGEAALQARASEIWQGKLSALKKPSAAATAPAAPATPAPKGSTPATPAAGTPAAAALGGVTPGGASTRVANVGGSPATPPSGVLTEDQIYDSMTLVK